MIKSIFAGAALAAALAVAGSAAAQNLVTNGDFSAGFTGFTSGYTYVPYPTDMHPEGLITIGPNPFAVHSSWVAFNDDNARLIVNGATTQPLPFVWQQDITGVGAGGYDFSLDVADICCNASYGGPNLPSLLTFSYSDDGGMNFTQLTAFMTNPPTDAGVMTTLSGSFVLPTAGTLRLTIGSGTNFAGGNDFAIDNISVTAAGVPEPATWAMMLAGFGGMGALLRRRRALAFARI